MMWTMILLMTQLMEVWNNQCYSVLILIEVQAYSEIFFFLHRQNTHNKLTDLRLSMIKSDQSITVRPKNLTIQSRKLVIKHSVVES